MIRRPPRSTLDRSSAASDVYKRQDLLLYHRKLKCFVVIELKTGKFKPEYTGQMNFYLSVLNDKMKLEDENSAIGIILCKEKNLSLIHISEPTRPY